MGEVVGAFCGGDGVERFADAVPQVVDRAFLGFAQQGFGLGEQLLDRVQVG